MAQMNSSINDFNRIICCIFVCINGELRIFAS